MDPRIADYLANADTFTSLVECIPPQRWDASSPCEGWSAADVVQHVIDTQRDFLAGRNVACGLAPAGMPAQRWLEHCVLVRRVLSDEAFTTAPYDGYSGPTTIADTMRDFYGWDMVVHRWDLGSAVGQEVAWSDTECAFVGGELEGFGDQLYSEGICKPAVEAPAGANTQARLLALLGRRA